MDANDVRFIYESMLDLRFHSALMDAALQDISARIDQMPDADAAPSSAVDTERDIMTTVVRILFPDYLNLYQYTIGRRLPAT